MAQQKTAYRLRIRTTSDTARNRWIIGGTQYSRQRVHARAEELRQAGRVVHVDLAEWYR